MRAATARKHGRAAGDVGDPRRHEVKIAVRTGELDTVARPVEFPGARFSARELGLLLAAFNSIRKRENRERAIARVMQEYAREAHGVGAEPDEYLETASDLLGC